MSIPAFNEHGLLPQGILNCSLKELGERFGGFQTSDRRPRLWQRLLQFIEELRRTGLVHELLIDRSFATDLPTPNELISSWFCPAGHDLRAELLPDAYNVVSKRRVRSRFGFDMFVVRAESVEYGKAVEFFTCVRGRPQQRKGMLRLQL